jgi:hypothetical protein
MSLVGLTPNEVDLLNDLDDNNYNKEAQDIIDKCYQKGLRQVGIVVI